MDDMILYEQTDNIFSDAEKIIEVTQKTAFRAVDRILILRNWLLGKRIFEEELQGEDRAAYGAEVIVKLAKHLNAKYGRGFSKRNLWEALRFYKAYPQIVRTACAELDSADENEIVRTMSAHFNRRRDETRGKKDRYEIQVHHTAVSDGGGGERDGGLCRTGVCRAPCLAARCAAGSADEPF